MHYPQIYVAYDQAVNDQSAAHFKFCPHCGETLSLKPVGGKQRPNCAGCGYTQFLNPSPGIVVVIERDGQVLLGKRSGSYGTGQWCLPGGFIEWDEDFLTAAIREVKEETNLDIKINTILNISANFLTPKLHTLTVILLATDFEGEPQPGDDLVELGWFSMTGPLPDMAFEAGTRIIEWYSKTGIQGIAADPDFARQTKLR